ncbi:MAG: DUF3794 domain-containing protein [Eubacteriales bacterium]
MALELIYSTKETGGMTYTGNTVGLSQASDENEPGVEGSLGAFISLDTTQQVGTFPEGTTLDIDKNGSAANLVIPENSEVLRAQLIWGGFFYLDYYGEVTDLTEEMKQPVTFIVPDGNSYEITADNEYITEYVYSEDVRRIYSNSTDVTELVKSMGAGTYSVEKITGITEPDSTKNGAYNHAGWTLAVVYKDSSLTERSMYIWQGNEFIRNSATEPNDISISGFLTPENGECNTRLLVSAQEGDADLTGDSLQFGSDVNNLVKLSGPNNPEDNFFCSQINDDNGNLDTTGTFGDRNADAFLGTNMVGGRQGWDITNIDVSDSMTNLQSEAVLRMTTSGDAYFINSVGMQIDALSTLTSITKSADVSYATVGDVVEFTVAIENNGNVTIDEIVFTDSDIEGGEFVAGSLQVDGVAMEKADPNEGVAIGELEVGETKQVIFQVELVSIPEGDITTNVAEITKYLDGVEVSTERSNEVTIEIRRAELTITNQVDRSETYETEVLTYTIVVENIGNQTAENIILEELLDDTLTYVEGTLMINGVLEEKQTPTSTILLEDMEASDTITITFQVVTGTDYEEDFQIKNQAVLDYEYHVEDSGSTILVPDTESNEVETVVLGKGVSVVKSVDQTLVTIGDQVTYQVEITNLGNTTITEVTLEDLLGSDVAFVEDSVVVNDMQKEGESPLTGIALPDLASKETAVVTFQVIATTENLKFTNIATTNYTKKVGNTSVNQKTPSNEVSIMIVEIPVTEVVKSANVEKAYIGDVVVCTIQFKNSSSLQLTNVILTDLYDTGYDFEEGSITINGVEKPLLTLAKGIEIGTVEGFATTTVTYELRVNESAGEELDNTATIAYTITNENTGETRSKTINSNTHIVTKVEESMKIIKSVSDNLVAVGDTVTYELEVQNDGTVTLENITIFDILPEELAFVEESVTIDDKLMPEDNITSGIEISKILQGESVMITFDATVLKTIDGGVITNTAQGNADYEEKDGYHTITAESNEVELEAIVAELTITKTVSVKSASLDEVVTYTVNLINDGNMDFNEVELYDILPNAMELVEGSVTLNGTVVNSVDLANGFIVGAIKVGEVVEVMYGAKVVSGTCDTKLTNQAYGKYEYIFSDGVKGTGETERVETTIIADISNFKQISLNEKVTIPCQKPDLQTLDDVTASIEIMDHYCVKVRDGISNEGQRLFGNKLIIHGEIHASIEYTSDCDSVYSAHWDIPFTTYIVLPKDYRKNRKVEVRGIIEHISARELNEREVEIGVLALMVASISK